jgi:hypothetical protein
MDQSNRFEGDKPHTWEKQEGVYSLLGRQRAYPDPSQNPQSVSGERFAVGGDEPTCLAQYADSGRLLHVVAGAELTDGSSDCNSVVRDHNVCIQRTLLRNLKHDKSAYEDIYLEQIS